MFSPAMAHVAKADGNNPESRAKVLLSEGICVILYEGYYSAFPLCLAAQFLQQETRRATWKINKEFALRMSVCGRAQRASKGKTRSFKQSVIFFASLRLCVG